MQTSKYLSRKDASAYLLATWGLKRSPNYLAKLAVVGGGPAFHKGGRDPLYAPSDLDGWATGIILSCAALVKSGRRRSAQKTKAG